MSVVSIGNQAAELRSARTGQIQKAAWAMRQRLRKQMNLLSDAFFDEVDDFVFEAGRQGQFTEGSDYLGAMREIRSKQSIFEETFLDTVAKNLESGCSQFDSTDAPLSGYSKWTLKLESSEIELATNSMLRKASKYYSPYTRQMESLISARAGNDGKYLIPGRTLISTAVLGFVEAQQTIEISLELRLVFMKLFERHFLMRMEKIFLDCISVLNKVENREFVDRLYSSSVSFRAPSANGRKLREPTESGLGKPVSKSVEVAANGAVQEIITSSAMPNFVRQMVDVYWRKVLLLIGQSKGVKSLEWHEAQHALRLLGLCSSGEIETNEIDKKLLVEKLSSGLGLLRVSNEVTTRFVDELKEHLLQHAAAPTFARAERVAGSCSAQVPDAMVSHSGQSIIDADDLSMISQLISGEQESRAVADSSENEQLLGILSLIDRMSACSSARMRVDDRSYNCIVNRSGSIDDVFVISNAGARPNDRKFAVTRSRLGLAISVSKGEIQLSNSAQVPAVSHVTVFESKP